MARLARLALPEQPHYLLLRGHNRQAIVSDDRDREQLLACLHDCAATQKLAMHAYALCSSELHLLLTPPQAVAISRAMQSFGRRYVAWFNKRHGRSGTLWDGRFRCAPLEAERHLLAAMRCIDSQPLAAGEALQAGDSPWSSCAHHLGRRRDPLVYDHPQYWALGNTPFERELAYSRLLDEGCSEAERSIFMAAVQRGLPLGGDAYLSALAQDRDRPLRARPRGRPRKTLA
ncbi:transposase [Paucibacter sp. APW11]|uniref:Transposase n=1 Tax=Roseateles aquae TaxID=3077235 RepID=A0ABU3PJ42_9BURK|nr:transposase [Paucibacter sp. APW11]MDT9002143.1 transposase [Paucibacter sp. APW11]